MGYWFPQCSKINPSTMICQSPLSGCKKPGSGGIRSSLLVLCQSESILSPFTIFRASSLSRDFHPWKIVHDDCHRSTDRRFPKRLSTSALRSASFFPSLRRSGSKRTWMDYSDPVSELRSSNRWSSGLAKIPFLLFAMVSIFLSLLYPFPSLPVSNFDHLGWGYSFPIDSFWTDGISLGPSRTWWNRLMGFSTCPGYHHSLWDTTCGLDEGRT